MGWRAVRTLERADRRPHTFSVAEHSLLVESAGALEPFCWSGVWLAALIHDRPESNGDLISPSSRRRWASITRLSKCSLLAAIHVRFGLPAVLPEEVTELIKRADKIAAYYEATVLAGF